MSKSCFRQTIPSPWHIASLSVPPGANPGTFGKSLERHLATRFIGRDWAWSPDEQAGRVVLATEDLTAMPVLLAHLLGPIPRVAETPRAVAA